MQPVAAADRKNSWSQIVYQTDDSPRYGAVGRWTFDNDVAEWTSQETLRPLARRDAVRHPPYDRYVAVNRHAITPTGWVQEEDNAKVGTKDGRTVTFTHETVVNSYNRATGFPIAAADDYWAATKDYWAKVRADWDAVLAANKQLVVPEVAEDGSSTGAKLGDLADDILGGTKKTETARRIAVGWPAMLKTKVEKGDTSRTSPVALRANIPPDVAGPLSPDTSLIPLLPLVRHRYPDTRY